MSKTIDVKSAAATLAACFALGMAGIGAAGAAEIQVLSAAMMKPIFNDIVPGFERASGHKVSIQYGTIGNVTQRVLAGEAADYVIASTLTMPRLVEAGRIEPSSPVILCKVGVGMVVPSGAAVPRVASVEDFKRAALAARVVVYADPSGGGAAGVHVARVFSNLGIAEVLKPKTRYGAGGDVTEVALAQGAGVLGITQISEIVGKPGAQFVGPVPAQLQNYTVCAGGVPVGAKNRDAVSAFVAALTSPAGIAVIRATGMEVD